MGNLKADPAKAKDFETAIEKSERPSLTDSGNAIRFVREHGKGVRFIAEFGKWILWDGKRWKFDDDGGIWRLAKLTARGINAEATDAELTGAQVAAISKHARQSENRRALEAMLFLARSELGITISQLLLDANPMLIAVLNGCIDLRTGSLIKTAREQYITKQIALTFDAEATCPQWEKFLNIVMGADADLIAYLQRLFGYVLTGLTTEQMLAFLYGHGANGKSTMLAVVHGIMGPYALQSPADTLLERRDGGINNDVARLRGARFVSCVEAGEGKRLAEAMVKAITGGDPVTARFLHQEFFQFQPEFKIFLAANHRPIIRGDDAGIWRRIHLVPFTVTIPPEKRDKALADKLRGEWQGILAWAVRGCLAWQREGLNPPAAVLEATQNYREEMDLIGAWITERCVVLPMVKMQVSIAHHNYTKWIEDRGARAMSQMSFSRKLEERGFERRKQGVVNFWGIGLVAEDGAVSPELSL